MPQSLFSLLFATLARTRTDAAFPRPVHRGIVRVAETAGRLTGKRIHLLKGGHLAGAGRAETQAIITRLQGMAVEKLAPSHCTGDAAIAQFRKAWGKDFVEGGLGGDRGAGAVRLEILSAESLGVRGLCCRVEAGKRVIVIDPGVALGNWRYELPPHPVQIAAGRAVRRRIVAALEEATDVVFSHFHGDHVPLFEPNPYQLGFSHLPPCIKTLRVWSLSPAGQSFTSQARARALMNLLGPHFQVAEGLADGPLCFSRAVPHGFGGLLFGSVMMTRVDVGGRVFVHASDIQLLDAATIDRILDWAPHWVLASGPPLYLGRLDAGVRARAWANARRLAAGVGTLILDHHLMRSLEGLAWLEGLSSAVGKRVVCAADFMGKPRRLLEAQRREFYAALPVRAGWHEAYARGTASLEDFGPGTRFAEEQVE